MDVTKHNIWLSLLWLVDTNNQQELSKLDQLEVLIFRHIRSLSCDFMYILNCPWFSVGVFCIICDLTSPRFSINFLTSSLIYFKGEQQSNIMTSYFILVKTRLPFLKNEYQNLNICFLTIKYAIKAELSKYCHYT